ncbi:hypothetical protein IPM62_01595 [Candidatus Woesebacteria bacterium]|nr:MAG: hypothetical protein IPM62_01595 [Candidatus Woesebacteria bacterium]
MFTAGYIIGAFFVLYLFLRKEKTESIDLKLHGNNKSDNAWKMHAKLVRINTYTHRTKDRAEDYYSVSTLD